MNATLLAPVTPGRGGGNPCPELPRREMESRLRAAFPSLSRSQATKIVRRNLRLSSAMQEAVSLAGGRTPDIDARAYRGSDPTPLTALANLGRGGAR